MFLPTNLLAWKKVASTTLVALALSSFRQKGFVTPEHGYQDSTAFVSCSLLAGKVKAFHAKAAEKEAQEAAGSQMKGGQGRVVIQCYTR